MLNLFKPPFWTFGRTSVTHLDFSDITTGLLSNLLKQKREIPEQDLDKAFEIARGEWQSLECSCGRPNASCQYERMTAMLRRIEQELDFF